jgi:NAD(P)-dependent dehydrogenase (short-subunit alcohol dehydrogenase family)
MTARGSGSIINLGSWVARLGIPVGALYASTKGAMETLTRAWAAEVGSPGVRVNAISPGVVRTPIENDPAAAMMTGTPYGGFGTPDAIAHAAVYLASDESQFVNGTVIDVDGGRVGVSVMRVEGCSARAQEVAEVLVASTRCLRNPCLEEAPTVVERFLDEQQRRAG